MVKKNITNKSMFKRKDYNNRVVTLITFKNIPHKRNIETHISN